MSRERTTVVPTLRLLGTGVETVNDSCGTGLAVAPSKAALLRTEPAFTVVGLLVEEATVDAAELRERQAPIKARYRSDPGAALVTLTARGELGAEQVSCSVDVGRQLVEAGLHPATGGDGSSACSGDMLLHALVACAGVTLRSVATNRNLNVTGTVVAEGDLDFRGTLGVDRDAPVGFRAIRLHFDLETAATPSDVDALLAATERYCVVYQTLVSGAAVEVSRSVHPKT